MTCMYGTRSWCLISQATAPHCDRRALKASPCIVLSLLLTVLHHKAVHPVLQFPITFVIIFAVVQHYTWLHPAQWLIRCTWRENIASPHQGCHAQDKFAHDNHSDELSGLCTFTPADIYTGGHLHRRTSAGVKCPKGGKLSPTIRHCPPV